VADETITREELAGALERVREMAVQWATLAGGVSVAPAADEVDAAIGRRLLDVIHGEPCDAAMRVQRLTVMAESWLVPGAPLFYPAAGQCVLDAIRPREADRTRAWQARAEAAEAALHEAATAERERIAAQVEALAAVSGGPSRTAYLNAAREIREGGGGG
jgi:hypothetical protein